jgi:hypothetical protein
MSAIAPKADIFVSPIEMSVHHWKLARAAKMRDLHKDGTMTGEASAG